MRISDWSSDVCSSDLGAPALCDDLVELRTDPVELAGHADHRRVLDIRARAREFEQPGFGGTGPHGDGGVAQRCPAVDAAEVAEAVYRRPGQRPIGGPLVGIAPASAGPARAADGRTPRWEGGEGS